MPKVLVDWLRQLSDKDAKTVWEYLDSGLSVDDAIEVIAQSHPTVELKICGKWADKDMKDFAEGKLA